MPLPLSTEPYSLHFVRDDGAASLALLGDSFVQLLSRNLQGGIMGGYEQEGFPLFCANQYMLDHLGFASFAELQEDLGGLVLNGIHSDDRARVTEVVNQALGEGQTYEVQYRMRRKGGSYIWVNDIGMDVTDGAGQHICISSIRDITQAVQARRELQERQARYNALYDSVVCGILELDVAPDSTARVVGVNTEAKRILGYHAESDDAPQSLYVPDLFVSEDHERILGVLRQLRETGASQSIEQRVRRADGSSCWILGTISLCERCGEQALLQCVFMDIDERKRTELQNLDLLQRNRMSDALLRLALEGTEIFEFYYYPPMGRLLVTERMRMKYGCARLYENMPNSFVDDFVSEDDRETLRLVFSQFSHGGQAHSCEFRTADGAHFCRLTLSVAESQTDGTPVAAVGLVEDRTEQKQAETRHSELTQLNREIIGSLEDLFFGIYRLNLNTGLMRTIRLGENGELAGLSVDREVVFHPEKLTRLYHPEDRDIFLRDLDLESLRHHQKQGVRSLETESRRLIGGEYRWVSRIVYLNNEKFGSDSAIILLSDVSHRRKQSSVIQALSQEYYALYYITLPSDQVDILRTDPVVAQTLEFKDHMEEQHPYTALFARYIEHFVHPAQRGAITEFFSIDFVSRTLNEQNPEVTRNFRKRIKNDYKWVQAKMILCEMKDGLPHQVTLAIRDVDHEIRHELETKQLLQDALARAENASLAKSDFLSKMSHDIRTPMNAIIGMTALAATALDRPERMRDCLDKIAVSSKHLLGLINEVLDMSKIESGKLDLDLGETNLSDLLQSTLTLVRPGMDAKKQTLAVSVLGVLHEGVVCDALRLQQVLVNIISNAVKYTPEGGNIQFTLTESASRLPQHACFTFHCRDNGIGMSQDYLAHLFEPFSRADDSRVSTVQGTGLGMAIAQNLVHMMNGEISCDSEQGYGTCFTVSLDLALTDSVDDCPAALQQLPVLVADDDHEACDSTCMLLSSIGLMPRGVYAGAQAVELTSAAHARGEDFFAVILDWQMPDLDGVDTARAIRAAVGPHVPIIILSAFDWSVIEDEARSAGVDAFLSKPLFRSRLTYLFKQLAGAEKPQPARQMPLSQQQNLLSGRHLLLVEDNEMNRDIARELLKLCGAQITEAKDGREAVGMFADAPAGTFDAVLMDVRMPVMGGYEATQTIRLLTHPDARTVPIIAMTADAFAEDVQRARDAGMNAHIAKPVDIERLLELLITWMKPK